jgi:hypothetical protein
MLLGSSTMMSDSMPVLPSRDPAAAARTSTSGLDASHQGLTLLHF